jgi:hypothetical protein
MPGRDYGKTFLKCKFCDWKTPKWAGRSDRIIGPFSRLKQHIESEHPEHHARIAPYDWFDDGEYEMWVVEQEIDRDQWVEIGSYTTEREADTVKAFMELHNTGDRYRKREVTE